MTLFITMKNQLFFITSKIDGWQTNVKACTVFSLLSSDTSPGSALVPRFRPTQYIWHNPTPVIAPQTFQKTSHNKFLSPSTVDHMLNNIPPSVTGPWPVNNFPNTIGDYDQQHIQTSEWDWPSRGYQFAGPIDEDDLVNDQHHGINIRKRQDEWMDALAETGYGIGFFEYSRTTENDSNFTMPPCPPELNPEEGDYTDNAHVAYTCPLYTDPQGPADATLPGSTTAWHGIRAPGYEGSPGEDLLVDWNRADSSMEDAPPISHETAVEYGTNTYREPKWDWHVDDMTSPGEQTVNVWSAVQQQVLSTTSTDATGNVYMPGPPDSNSYGSTVPNYSADWGIIAGSLLLYNSDPEGFNAHGSSVDGHSYQLLVVKESKAYFEDGELIGIENTDPSPDLKKLTTGYPHIAHMRKPMQLIKDENGVFQVYIYMSECWPGNKLSFNHYARAYRAEKRVQYLYNNSSTGSEYQWGNGFDAMNFFSVKSTVLSDLFLIGVPILEHADNDGDMYSTSVLMAKRPTDTASKAGLWGEAMKGYPAVAYNHYSNMGAASSSYLSSRRTHSFLSPENHILKEEQGTDYANDDIAFHNAYNTFFDGLNNSLSTNALLWASGGESFSIPWNSVGDELLRTMLPWPMSSDGVEGGAFHLGHFIHSDRGGERAISGNLIPIEDYEGHRDGLALQHADQQIMLNQYDFNVTNPYPNEADFMFFTNVEDNLVLESSTLYTNMEGSDNIGTPVSISVEGIAGSDDNFDTAIDGGSILYKVSLLYDGYQESPLSFGIKDVTLGTVLENVKITINIQPDLLNKRITHVNIYRKTQKASEYTFLDSIKIRPIAGWASQTSDNGTNYLTKYIRDYNEVGPFYSSIVGISEAQTSHSVQYGLSTSMDSFLFVTNASAGYLSDDVSRYIFRSMPGKFSQFRWSSDFQILPDVPVALKGFRGKLYAFTKNKTYKINPATLEVEDVFDGVGCFSEHSVIVTEYGMCFADKNNIYLHDGNTPTVISSQITTSSNKDGWQDIAKSYVRLGFDEIRKAYLIFFDNVGGEECEEVAEDSDNRTLDEEMEDICLHATHLPPYLCWAYNLIYKRWDLWSTEGPITATGIRRDGKLYYGTEDGLLYKYLDGSAIRNWAWISKQLTMNGDTQIKRLKNWRLQGPNVNNLSLKTIKLDEEVMVSEFTIDDVASSEAIGKVTGRKKFKSLQLVIAHVSSTIDEEVKVDAIGLIYKPKPIK